MPENPYSCDTGPQNIPDNLKIPEGNVLLLQAFGKGIQKYACPVSASSKATPHAILLKDDRDEGDLVAIHFGGPTWEALDGSSVVGDTTQGVLQSAPAPDPDGVPWLRLTAKSHGGNGLFSQVTYIQRLFTDGGQPPTSGCDQAHNETEVLVEYSAQYFFYGPATEQK